jgi:UDP-N-acetylglucosamine 2-epimerase
MSKIAIILGTRPEAVKLCPLVLALKTPFGGRADR